MMVMILMMTMMKLKVIKIQIEIQIKIYQKQNKIVKIIIAKKNLNQKRNKTQKLFQMMILIVKANQNKKNLLLVEFEKHLNNRLDLKKMDFNY